MPAGTIWTPSILSNEDTVMGFMFEQSHCPDYSQANRIRDCFVTFCALNNLEPGRLDTYVLLVGQWQNSGLAAGTVQQYLSFLDAPSAVRSGVALCHARAKTKHAPDLPEEDLRAITSAAHLDVQPTMWLMWATGCHAADAGTLPRSNWSIKHPRLIVCWQSTKSIRSRSQRDTLVYDITSFPAPAAVMSSAQAASVTDDTCLFTASAVAVNKALSPLSTSLVFRRAFEHRYREAGYTEEAIGRLLTHQGTKMVRAHYSTTKVRDLLDDDDTSSESEDDDSVSSEEVAIETLPKSKKARKEPVVPKKDKAPSELKATKPMDVLPPPLPLPKLPEAVPPLIAGPLTSSTLTAKSRKKGTR
jgi:hypothetical protein